ncbi:MAG: hypothetical protein U5K76_15425 [Woeseiaceae bacterium]|nr:hypothetical protein [Woeseiaceae bacterium]
MPLPLVCYHHAMALRASPTENTLPPHATMRAIERVAGFAFVALLLIAPFASTPATAEDHATILLYHHVAEDTPGEHPA